MITASQRAELEQTGCEAAFDNLTCQLYATDASIYQLVPAAVAFPRTGQEASQMIQAAAAMSLPVIPRGAGTGLAGGALGRGLILEFARHFRNITELNLEARTVRVGAGVVLDQLNRFLQPHGLRFGPDVATSSRATLGGMIANNSSGSHVPVYGTTADHLDSLDLVMADGRRETIGPNSPSLSKQNQLIARIVERAAPFIQARMPAGLLKRWPGYGLDRYLRAPGNLSDILSGSEGTLAGITSAVLKLVPLPRQKGLGLLFFSSVIEAMQATVELLNLRPAAIEHIDRVLFDQTRGQIIFQEARDLMELDSKPCESILLVEFFEDAEERLNALARKKLGLRQLLIRSDREMNLVWALRKAGLSLLTGCKGSAKPATGIEDTVVRPEVLPAYVRGLQSLMRPLGLHACFYGHAAAGLLHVRPVLDLHKSEEVRKFRQLAQEVSALVKQFKGSIAGEHGVGMARTEFMLEHLGPELMEAHREIKRIFDPHFLFNPGKIVAADPFRFDENLRGVPDREPLLPFAPRLAFAAKDESFAANLQQCNGCGGCRKETPTMCPTFLATGEEMMSTRGRANAIRALLENRIEGGADPLRAAELEAALSNCLSCKACTSECPSNVNMALLKAELSYASHSVAGWSWRERLLSSLDRLGQMGCWLPQLSNAALQNRFFRQLLQRWAGFSARRPLPSFARQRFDRWFARRIRPVQEYRGKVLLWDDTFVRYHEPRIGAAAVRVLEASGFEVQLVNQRRCCGRPAFSQGDLDRAARDGTHNLQLLSAGAGQNERALPILFLEPSCYSMFVEDYRELRLPGAVDVAARCRLFEQFMAEVLEKEPHRVPVVPQKTPLTIHGHCHAKAITNPAYMKKLGQCLSHGKVVLLESGCCGMAGAFGALESKYDLSVRIAQPLIQSLAQGPAGQIVVASGTSCRHQIEHLTSWRPRHMTEVMADALQTS